MLVKGRTRTYNQTLLCLYCS